MVRQVPDFELFIERERDAGVRCAGKVALSPAEELRGAREELLNIVVAQSRHSAVVVDHRPSRQSIGLEVDVVLGVARSNRGV
jgi:DNA-directed RNA polymerase subunit F